MKRIFSELFVCVLFAGLVPCSPAFSQGMPASGTAEAVQAISDVKAAAMMENFSSSRVQLSQKDGEKIYQAICQGCHMPQGQGAKAVGFYPPLASNPRLAAGAYPTLVVLNGLHGMPSFASRLNDDQVAAVVNYVRSSFGNHFPDHVNTSDVKSLRK